MNLGIHHPYDLDADPRTANEMAASHCAKTDYRGFHELHASCAMIFRDLLRNLTHEQRGGRELQHYCHHGESVPHLMEAKVRRS